MYKENALDTLQSPKFQVLNGFQNLLLTEILMQNVKNTHSHKTFYCLLTGLSFVFFSVSSFEWIPKPSFDPKLDATM